jgi:predicted anti-sigma-YlaC factor YlaD
MQETHIINMIEQSGVAGLSEIEVAKIEIHIALCADCRRAYRAAQVSGDLLRARAAESVEASPFFSTRVMAALRERELSPELPALLRMWRAAGALVSVMAALVVLLIGLTIFDTGSVPQAQASDVAAVQNIYSPEYVVFGDGDNIDDNIQYDQVLTTVYGAEDVDGQ